MTFDRSAFQAYVGNMDELFGGANHPEADATREWIDVRTALPPGMYERVRCWAAALPYRSRPGSYPLSNSYPGGWWCNSEPVVAAVGRALEGEVSRVLGRRARLSYAGVLVTLAGVAMTRHRDIGSGSKYLLSWPAALDVDGEWPLHVERPSGGAGVDVLDNSSADRALLFAGHDVHHWRPPYPGREGRMLFMRYSTFEPVRTHSSREIDLLADAGLDELDGRPRLGDVEHLMEAGCTSQRLAHEPRTHFLFPSLLSAGECRTVVDTKASGPPSWLTGRLRRIVADATPGMISGCAFAGHEHRSAIGFARGAAGWAVDLAESETNRVRVVVCLNPDNFTGITIEGHGPVTMQPGDALIFRSDVGYFWPPSPPQLTAVYGLPPDLVERSRERNR